MKKYTILFLVLITIVSFAQDNEKSFPASTGVMPKSILVSSIAKQINNGTFIEKGQNESPKLGHPKLRGGNNVIPGKGYPKTDDALVSFQKESASKRSKEPLLVFNANTTVFTPSDPTGAVGPNHYVGAWNTGFRIFDKQGNPLTPEASLSTLFPGNNAGDPIVLYDAQADRFIITEFDHSPNGLNVAICQGPDPVNDDWYIYTTGFGTGNFPDYPKFSIWSDGYYVTANISSTNKVYAMERDKMLVGDDAQFALFPLPGIIRNGFFSPQFFNVSDGNLPDDGNATVVYLQDDAWGGVSQDHLKLWTVDVDWTNVSSSTISSPLEIVTTPFISVFDGGSFFNRPQPSGPDLDVLQAIVMNQAQFHKFDDHNSVVFNFVVDTDGSDGELAGIRWYELRQNTDGEAWEIYQEGTYISPNNNKDAFSGSMAMDFQGNIGMAYTTVSSTEKIAIYYTGRYAGDPLGQMTVDETLIAQSTHNNPYNRLADYVHLTVDPVDDRTFWHIAEYFNNNQRTDVVAAFQIAPDFVNDIGVASLDSPESGALTSEEDIMVTIFNTGENNQSDFGVHYQINGGSVISETFTADLLSQEYASYTFSQKADLSNVGETYEIIIFTSLSNDEYPENDTLIAIIKSIGPYDIGVATITAPKTGEGLVDDEDVVVKIMNFGTEEQQDFNVSYVIDGSTVTEVVSEPILFQQEYFYTFTEKANLSEAGLYPIIAYTSLLNDSDLNNDTSYKVVYNSDCIPYGNCDGGHAIKLFNLLDINNESECSEDGYGDYVSISTPILVNSTNDLTISTAYGNHYVKVWIDFNDNFIFEYDEVVVDNVKIADGEGAGTFTLTMDLTIPQGAPLGEHLMRSKLSWLSSMGDDSACDDIVESGEIEDYMVEVQMNVGIETQSIQNSELMVANLGNNLFKVSLYSDEIKEPLSIDIHNTRGQCLLHNRVMNDNGTYSYDIDMSYAKPGMYIVRLGTVDYGKIKKIIVK